MRFKHIAQVWGSALLIIALGTFINSFHPDFSILEPLDQMTPGNWFIFVGMAVAMFAWPLNAFRKKDELPQTLTRNVTVIRVIPIISRVADWRFLWLALVGAIVLFVAPQFMAPWALPFEALGGFLLVIIGGLFMWRFFFDKHANGGNGN